MTPEIDNWLTAVRVRRLPAILAAVRTHPRPGVPEQRIERVAWNRCDGPLADIDRLLDVLVRSGLLEHRGTLTCLTTKGHRVTTQDHQQGGRLLARTLIDAGYFRNQARRLLGSGEFTTDGDLVCNRSHALRVAAQLTGVLRRWKEVVLDRHLRVPAVIVDDLLSTWALQPVPRFRSGDARQEVGDRAEAYSYRMELESSGDPSRVQWVALDDDSLGYDIRNGAQSPPRYIEVKGSQGREVRFFLSSNEWEVGHRLRESYELHFWGEINLARPRREEYRILRAAGYPRVFCDVVSAIESGDLTATPSQYLFTEGRSP